MNVEQIVTLLKEERDKVDRAIQALEGGALKKGPAIEIAMNPNEPKRKRHVSAASRRKMALAQKKRWAALKDKIG